MRFLPHMLAVSGVLAVVAAVVGLVFAGGAGALGAAAGVTFVAVAYALSTLLLEWIERVNRPMMLPAALFTYLAKIVALAVLLGALRPWAGLKPMVFGVAAAALVWIIAQARWLAKAKILYVDLERK
jgi:ATP synthase protein I